MTTLHSADNRKDIEIYSYGAERNGNIELNFHIDEPGHYKLVITAKEISGMEDTSKMMIEANKSGYFD